MLQKPKQIVLTASLGLLLLAGTTGCETIPITTYYGNYGYDDYYYYPYSRTYYHPYSGYYYYPYRTKWIKVKKLPKDKYIHKRDRVRLKDRDRKPYYKNPEHKKRYRHRHHRHDSDENISERERNRELFERLLKNR